MWFCITRASHLYYICTDHWLGYGNNSSISLSYLILSVQHNYSMYLLGHATHALNIMMWKTWTGTSLWSVYISQTIEHLQVLLQHFIPIQQTSKAIKINKVWLTSLYAWTSMKKCDTNTPVTSHFQLVVVHFQFFRQVQPGFSLTDWPTEKNNT